MTHKTTFPTQEAMFRRYAAPLVGASLCLIVGVLAPTQASAQDTFNYDSRFGSLNGFALPEGSAKVIRGGDGFRPYALSYEGDDLTTTYTFQDGPGLRNAEARSDGTNSDMLHLIYGSLATPAAEFDPDGTAVRYNLPGGIQYDPTGAKLAVVNDHLVSARALFVAGRRQARYDYATTGRATVALDEGSSDAAKDYAYLFQGQRYLRFSQTGDQPVGVSVFAARTYSAEIARWLEMDPARAGVSPYTAMADDFVNNVDYWGTLPFRWGRFLRTADVRMPSVSPWRTRLPIHSPWMGGDPLFMHQSFAFAKKAGKHGGRQDSRKQTADSALGTEKAPWKGQGSSKKGSAADALDLTGAKGFEAASLHNRQGKLRKPQTLEDHRRLITTYLDTFNIEVKGKHRIGDERNSAYREKKPRKIQRLVREALKHPDLQYFRYDPSDPRNNESFHVVAPSPGAGTKPGEDYIRIVITFDKSEPTILTHFPVKGPKSDSVPIVE